MISKMAKNITGGVLVVFFAVLVLLASIYKTTVIKYHFLLPNDSSKGQPVFVSGMEYSLPYPGILPGELVWPLKAMREKLDLYFTTDPLEKAERSLFLADKRLAAARDLARDEDWGRAVSTSSKAEKYLESSLSLARSADTKGENASGLFETLFKASLTHREVLEKMMITAPSDAKPLINKTLDYPKSVTEQTLHELNERGKSIPTSTPTPSDSTPSAISK